MPHRLPDKDSYLASSGTNMRNDPDWVSFAALVPQKFRKRRLYGRVLGYFDVLFQCWPDPIKAL